PYQMIWKIL
ncbi:unnamed protein product, partial [Allacma fusca]